MAKTLKIKEERIELRVTREDKRVFEKAAQMQGLSLNSYVVTRTLSAAREDAVPYKTYVPSAQSLQAFERLLESPPAPNRKLKLASSRHKKEVL